MPPGERHAPILVHAHARSGSTLLLEMLSQDPELWAAYEPLQDIRQLPPKEYAPDVRCRRSEIGYGEPLASRCPLRDAMLLLALLMCDMLPMIALWYHNFEIDGHTGGYVPHSGTRWGSAWSPAAQFPDIAISRTRQYLVQGQACRQRRGAIVKTVRMNGDLDAIFRVASTFATKPPLVLHLVREPLSVYASRKNLSKPFGIPSTVANGSLRSWAKRTCAATRHDIATGKAQATGSYELVTFSELLYRPRQLVKRIYTRHLNRAVPRAVHEYIRSHIKPERGYTGYESQAWQFKYGTSSRNIERVHNRWRDQLQQWEVHQIELGCRSSQGQPLYGSLLKKLQSDAVNI